jgi:hypothetical protein
MKWLFLLFGLFSSCSDCNVTEATGSFEIFKTQGCSTSDETVNPSGGMLMSIVSLGEFPVTIQLGFQGINYVGRRGTCALTDPLRPSQQRFAPCDYVMRSVTKINDKESRYTVEVLSAGVPGVYSFKGVFSANSVDRGSP